MILDQKSRKKRNEMEKPKDKSQGILTDFFSKPKPTTKTEERPTPTLKEQSPKKTERELTKEGYKKIITQYKGMCDICGQRFPPSTPVYWKKEGTRTKMVCPNCFQ